VRAVLVIGAGGLLLWYLDTKGYFAGIFGASTTTPVTTGTGTTTTTTTGTGTSTTPGFNSLAAIYQRMVADAGSQAASTGLTAYGWNYSLARVTSITPPDPLTLWSGGADQQPMTASQYWSVMAPALTAQFGLSGVRSMRGMGGWAA